MVPLTGTCAVFDGNRKGLVIGGGIGIGPKAFSSTSSGWSQVDESGFATNFIIGHAWSENNMVALLHDAVYFKHTFGFGSTYGGEFYTEDKNVAQGLIGMALFRYYGPPGRSLYLVFGMGMEYRIPLDDDYDMFDAGPGLLLGGGYQFMRHVQFYGSLSGGTTTEGLTRYYHYQVLFTFTAVAF